MPGDLRSYGGGNGLPRAVKQSPNFSQIVEEEEEEEREEDEEDETRADVSILLVRLERCARLLSIILSHFF